MGYESNRIYVGNLPPNFSAADLKEHYSQFGSITDCNVKAGATGKCFGFVAFEEKDSADSAISATNHSNIDGNTLKVEMTYNSAPGGGRDRERDGRRERPQGPPRGEFRVKVHELPRGTSWQDLKDHFKDISSLTFADISRTNAAVGFVEFQSESGMKEAIETYNGRPFSTADAENSSLVVEVDTEKRPPIRSSRPPPRGGMDRFDYRDSRDNYRGDRDRDMYPRDRDVHRESYRGDRDYHRYDSRERRRDDRYRRSPSPYNRHEPRDRYERDDRGPPHRYERGGRY